MIDQRMLRYQAMLMENPGLTISPREVINPDTLLPMPVGSPLSFLPRNLGSLDKTPRGIVRRFSDQSWGNPVHWLQQLCLGWKKKSWICSSLHFEIIEAKPLPPNTWAQLAEFIALTRVLELGKGKWVVIYTDSKFVFLVLHATCFYLERKRPLEHRRVPNQKSLGSWRQSICVLKFRYPIVKDTKKGTQKWHEGTQAADRAAKRAALQNNDLIEVDTLVPQANLPETPSYTEGET